MPDPTLTRRSLVKAAAAGVSLAAVPWTASAAGSNAASPPPFTLGRIAFVPLDDRPYTWYAPQKLAGGAGFEMVAPQRSELGRHFTPGDGAAAGQWLVRESVKTDCSIVALPMLAYGGLLNSRNSSVSLEDALRQLDAVRTVRLRNPGKRQIGRAHV